MVWTRLWLGIVVCLGMNQSSGYATLSGSSETTGSNRWPYLGRRSMHEADVHRPELNFTTGRTHHYPGIQGTSETKLNETLAMCLMIRDQHEEVREWLDHYLRLGAARIYVFDHASPSPIISHIADYVASGIVEYEYVTNAMMLPIYSDSTTIVKNRTGPQLYPQCWVFHECLRRYGQRHQWMGFFDPDEFLLLRDRSVPNLPAFLKRYEDYGGLVVHWRTFGSSGYIDRPEGSVLANYKTCNEKKSGMNQFIKTIANTRYTIATKNNPHQFRYIKGKYAVNERFEAIDSSLSANITMEEVVLNHYVSKSARQNEAKTKRGGGHAHIGKPKAFFVAVDSKSTENCSDSVHLMEGRHSVYV